MSEDRNKDCKALIMAYRVFVEVMNEFLDKPGIDPEYCLLEVRDKMSTLKMVLKLLEGDIE